VPFLKKKKIRYRVEAPDWVGCYRKKESGSEGQTELNNTREEKSRWWRMKAKQQVNAAPYTIRKEGVAQRLLADDMRKGCDQRGKD